MFEFPIWLVRLSAAFLLVWTVALVVSRLLRKPDAVPTMPFGSRKEYLEAAFEMDLDLFLARARVTPRDVILKPNPPATFICSAKGCWCRPSDAPKPEEQKTSGAGFGSGHISVSMTPYPDGVMGFNALAAQSAAAFRQGQWVRIKNPEANLGNALGHVVKVGPDFVRCIFACGELSYFSGGIEPAYPKQGEWWRWTKDQLLCGARAENFYPFAWKENSYMGTAKEDVDAGNLEPVNFGKGEEKKSGVA